LHRRLRAGNAQTHDEVLVDLGANVGDDFAQESQPSVEITAVFVVAQVDARIQELRG
jgi:hypothetical protein